MYHHKCKSRLDDPHLPLINDKKALKERREQNKGLLSTHQSQPCAEICVVPTCRDSPKSSNDVRHPRIAGVCKNGRVRKQAEYDYLCRLLRVETKGNTAVSLIPYSANPLQPSRTEL